MLALDENMAFRKAEEEGVCPAVIVAEQGFGNVLIQKKYWIQPVSIDVKHDGYARNINLLVAADNVIAEFSRSIANTVQFPPSSVYLHALGVVSAIMVDKFFVRKNQYSSANTVALYTVVAQPPSTGKSGVNELLTEAAEVDFGLKSRDNKLVRMRIEHEIKNTEKEMSKTKNPREFQVHSEKILAKQEELKTYPLYEWFTNDPTPEGCEKQASDNNGFFNIISDESSAIKVALGMVYGGDVTNNGIFLKAWDNGDHKVSRMGRKGFSGRVRGAVCVLAQDSAVRAILEVGKRDGEGVSERFLVLHEQDLLGHRDHLKDIPINMTAKKDYDDFVRALIFESAKVVFTLDAKAEEKVREIKQELEPEMGEKGAYFSAMLRGVVGKADKQIMKMASVLHAADEWKTGGRKSTNIPVEKIEEAYLIYRQLLRAYVTAADSKGFSGEVTESKKIIERLEKYAKAKKFRIVISKLRDDIKGLKDFSGLGDLTSLLREKYLPPLQAANYLVYSKHENCIYINPLLEG